jgi:hypothetical protein
MGRVTAEEDKNPICVDQLGSAADRRYIVTEGAGFIGGYIVKHLLASCARRTTPEYPYLGYATTHA